jgi:glutamate racemase
MSSSLPIAVFDSGVGGLTVFQSLVKLLPQENFIYLADNKRVPYGDLSAETIVQYTSEAISFLESQKVKMVVLGCHTASSRCLYRDKVPIFQVPVMGMIQGVLRKIQEIQSINKVAILGTLSTIESRVYERLILSRNPSIKVISIACPSLVPKIESGLFSSPETLASIEEYLKSLKGVGVDGVLLACTHYPLIVNAFKKILGEDLLFIDPSDAIAQEVRDYLEVNNLFNVEGKGARRFYVTDAPEMFAKQGSYFLKEEIIPEKIFLTQG